MRLSEIKPTRPHSAEQLRLAALKRAADQAQAQVQAQRQRKRLQAAQQAMQRLQGH